MASRKKFVMLDHRLSEQKWYKNLSTNSHRYAYLSAQISPNATYIAYFYLPLGLWSLESQIDVIKLEAIVRDLCKVGAIEYDFDNEHIRIVGWFNGPNCPTNASHLAGLIKDCSDDNLDSSRIHMKVCAELLLAACKVSSTWNPEKDLAKARLFINRFSEEIFGQYGDDFLREIALQLKGIAPSRHPISAVIPEFSVFVGEAFTQLTASIEPVSREW